MANSPSDTLDVLRLREEAAELKALLRQVATPIIEWSLGDQVGLYLPLGVWQVVKEVANNA